MSLDFRELLTVKGAAEEAAQTAMAAGREPPFTESKLRAYIHKREHNGFGVVLLRVGGRWFLDPEKLNEWYEGQRLQSGPKAG